MSEKTKITRRSLLKQTGVAATIVGFPIIVPRSVLGGRGHTAPSEKLNIAGIGVGSQGGSNIGNITGHNIVALCDVDFQYAAKTFAKYPDAKQYRDYRVMLEDRKDIDAVVIGTPDHTHAVISMAAIKAGKHVYCQKPMTQNIQEARMVTQAARKAGVITQMGIQGHSGEGRKLICEWVWDGAIGEVKEVDAWCSLSYDLPNGRRWGPPVTAAPDPGMPIPETLDWDTWLGPRAYRPYHTCYHPKIWRRWLDFGCGMMGDRGAHTFDPIVSALKLGPPTSVKATNVSGGNKELHAGFATIAFNFAARGGLSPVKLTWYEGAEPPRPECLEEGRRLHDQGGFILKGDKGMIMAGVYGNSPRLIPESAMKAYKLPAQTIPRANRTHEQEWVDSIKAGTLASANFDYSGPLTETSLLGNLAKHFPDQTLRWDAEKMRVTNVRQANQYVGSKYRKGWSL